MRGEEGQTISQSPPPYPPPQNNLFTTCQSNGMAMFEIAVGPSIAKNIRTFRTPGSDRRLIEDPATTHQRGSITSDWKKDNMTLEWANEEEFLAWRAAKESDNTIELIVSKVVHSNSPIWRERHVLRCSREWMGGQLAQNKSGDTAKRDRKIPSKKTGCRCRLTIKLYWHTETILGEYEREQGHPLRDENLRFTWLSDTTRNLVMDLVHIGFDTKVVVSRVPCCLSC